MVGEPSSPREARLAALRILAETVISKADDEKGNWDWTGRSEVLEVIALLSSVNRSKLGEQISEVAPTSSRPEGDSPGVEISPTIPWVAEEERRPDELTIVKRGQLFSAWNEKRRRLREG